MFVPWVWLSLVLLFYCSCYLVLLVVPSFVCLLMCRFYYSVWIGVVESAYLPVLCYALSYLSVDLEKRPVTSSIQSRVQTYSVVCCWWGRLPLRFRCGLCFDVVVYIVMLLMGVGLLGAVRYFPWFGYCLIHVLLYDVFINIYYTIRPSSAVKNWRYRRYFTPVGRGIG